MWWCWQACLGAGRGGTAGNQPGDPTPQLDGRKPDPACAEHLSQILEPEESQRVAEEAAIATKSVAEETGRQDSALAMGSHVDKHRELESEVELIRREREAKLEAWQG